MMNTVVLDSNTYRDVERFAKANNIGVADVVKESLHYFLKKFKSISTDSANAQYFLPEHLKRMRGVLSGVEDVEDERLNYIMKK